MKNIFSFRTAGRFFLLFCAGLSSFLYANTRIELVDEQILSTEDVLQNVTDESDKKAFERKLSLLKKEREILVRRMSLQAKEQALSGKFNQNAKQQLTDFLSSIDFGVQEYENQLKTLKGQIQNHIAERENLETQIERLKLEGETGANALTEMEMQRDVLIEEMRAFRLEQRSLEFKIRLIQEGVSLKTNLDALPVNPRPTTRNLFELRRYLQGQKNAKMDTEVLVENLKEQREGILEAQKISKAQLESLDAEISVLNDKLSGINKLLKKDALLSRARAQKRLVSRITDAENAQVLFLEKSIETLRDTLELYEKNIHFREDYNKKYFDGYFRRILIPLASISGIFILYFLLSRILFPFVFESDELFNARRLGGYSVVILSFIIISLYFLDDLQAIATVFGIAGAALVIALQDLLSSIAGWFVIVSSRKVKVGDRVEVEGTRGDIIDIQLLRTTLIELNEGLGVDQPTGRIVVIPNSYIFKSQVLNYSHMHRYIWGSIDILITFESSMEKAREVLTRVFEEECAADIAAAKSAASTMEVKYGVADSQYEYKMYVSIEDSGVLFKILFVTHYKRMAFTKSRISSHIAKAFEETEGIEFAYPTSRYIPTAEKDGFEVKIHRESERPPA